MRCIDELFLKHLFYGRCLDDFQVRRYLTYYEDCDFIEGSDRHTG